MELEKMFQMQKELDHHIEKEHPRKNGEDRLNKKILALQVELGELANEWRGFKFWSKDQEPRTIKLCHICVGTGTLNYQNPFDDEVHQEPCETCRGTGDLKKNPLLEEYVDCLHFILSIGNEIDVTGSFDWDELTSFEDDITNQFLEVSSRLLDMRRLENESRWNELFEEFYILGYMLDFTWEQIEQAYISKNQVNHERQEGGY